MKEPVSILENGTKIVTHKEIARHPEEMFVHERYKLNRRTRCSGTICGWVSGHGGDVYWVRHEDGSLAAYSWLEFELA